MPSIPVSVVKAGLINIGPPAAKRATVFTCMGWIKNPVIPDAAPLTLLAVADYLSNDLSSERTIRIDLAKDGTDYRLQFSNSKSKLVAKSSGVALDDEDFHLLTYISDGNGLMRYYVDAIEIPAEDGYGDEGILYSIAWSRHTRLGGGDVCVPCLDTAGQSVSLYNWRFGAGFTLHQEWIRELYLEDLPTLNPEETAA